MTYIPVNRKDLLDRSSPLPAYQQIANDIMQRILQQEWDINDKLPAESELGTEYGVSRVTVRQAMSQLEKDGFIIKFQGKGAFVKQNPRQLTQELEFPSLDSVRTNAVKSKIIKIQKMFAPNQAVEDRLQVHSNTPLIYIERIFYHNQKPTGINHVWFRKSDVPGLTEESLLDGSISKTLKHTYHFEITEIENYIESVRLDAVSAALLNTFYDASGLKIDSQYFLSDGTPIEYSSTIWLGEFTRFHFKVNR